MTACTNVSPDSGLVCALEAHGDDVLHQRRDDNGTAFWPTQTYQPHRSTREPIPDADGWVYGVAWRDDDGALRVSGPRHRDEAEEAVAVLRGAPVALGIATDPDPDAAHLVRARPLAWGRVPMNEEQN